MHRDVRVEGQRGDQVARSASVFLDELVVCIRLPACRTRKPMPDSTAIISAATSKSSAVPAPRRSPAKIIGSAEGRDDLADDRPAARAEGDGGASSPAIRLSSVDLLQP